MEEGGFIIVSICMIVIYFDIYRKDKAGKKLDWLVITILGLIVLNILLIAFN